MLIEGTFRGKAMTLSLFPSFPSPNPWLLSENSSHGGNATAWVTVTIPFPTTQHWVEDNFGGAVDSRTLGLAWECRRNDTFFEASSLIVYLYLASFSTSSVSNQPPPSPSCTHNSHINLLSWIWNLSLLVFPLWRNCKCMWKAHLALRFGKLKPIPSVFHTNGCEKLRRVWKGEKKKKP